MPWKTSGGLIEAPRRKRALTTHWQLSRFSDFALSLSATTCLFKSLPQLVNPKVAGLDSKSSNGTDIEVFDVGDAAPKCKIARVVTKGNSILGPRIRRKSKIHKTG